MVPVRAWAGAALHAFAPMNGFSPPARQKSHRRLRADFPRRVDPCAAGLRHRHRDGRQRGDCPSPRRPRTSRRSARCCASARTSSAPQPRVLLVAPLSGHFATLLRNTVRTMLPEHDVYITDWHNARDAPISAGRFGFDEYVEHLIKFLEVIGAGRAYRCGVPALRRNAGRGRRDGAAEQSGAAALDDLDGRADRLPRQPDEGERARDLQADVVVRAEPDRDRADALSGRVPEGLSGLRAARRLHEHEHRPARKGASRALRQSGRGRTRQGGSHQGVLRRVLRGAGSFGRVLSRNRANRVPGVCARGRHLEIPR